MLSVCIPHYNFINPRLFESIFAQAKLSKVEFEVLVIDDASLSENKRYLEDFSQPEYNIHFLGENIGRSAIRNLLARKAKYPYLLFLDADSEIISEAFITDYLKNIGNKIVCGGRIYSKKAPLHDYLLHYKYGSKVEQFADAHFQSNNFLIPKAFFSKLAFDENIQTYGYEDVVFGLEAKKLGLELVKINNPVAHAQLKTNEEFVNDLEEALKNLKKLTDANPKMAEAISVSAFYQRLVGFRLDFLLSIQQGKVLGRLRNLFSSKNPIGANLMISIYKLYYYHSLQKR